MALSVPPSLEELVVVNDIDPLSGLTPRLRRDASLGALRLVEYAPNSFGCWQQCRGSTPIYAETEPRSLLWEVDPVFRVQTPEEIEATRLTRLQMLAEQANEYRSRQVVLLATLGLKPSPDAPFSRGEKVWYVSIFGCPRLRRCLIRRVPPAPRRNDDEFAYANVYLTYLLECRQACRGRRSASIHIEADPQCIFRARPTLLTPFPVMCELPSTCRLQAGGNLRHHLQAEGDAARPAAKGCLCAYVTWKVHWK